MAKCHGVWSRHLSQILDGRRLPRPALAVWLAASVLFGGVARASTDADDAVISVGRVEIRFPTMDAVSTPDLSRVPVAFFRDGDGTYAEARDGAATDRVLLGEFSDTPVRRVHPSGLRSMLRAVHDEVSRLTGGGAYVVTDPDQLLLGSTVEDYRQGGSDLRILVYPSARLPITPTAEAAVAPIATEGSDATPETPAALMAASDQAAPVPVAQHEAPAAEPAPPARIARAEPAPASAPTTPPSRAAATNANASVAASAAPTSPAEPDKAIDGEAPLSMTGFTYTYARPSEQLPAVETIDDVTVQLVRVANGFIARPGAGESMRLGDLGANGAVGLYPSAIKACEQAIVDWFRQQSIAGVYVVPDVRYVDPETWGDYRDQATPPMTDIPLTIYAARVTRVKSIASGTRVPTDERLNSPLHTRIVNNSPLQPWSGEGARNDLLRIEPLNIYAYRLSRQPGRRVDVAVANASVPGDAETLGDAEVQYLVQEVKPWTAYFQFSNTGTKETGEWRERFGFVHNQLLGFDDIFTLDYITSEFADSNAVIGSYDVPLVADDSIRLRVDAGWSEYNASNVGVQNERFDGKSFFVGPELSVNVFQRDDFFIDAYGGFRYQDIEVTNRGVVGGRGHEQVFVGQAGLRADRQRAEYSFTADLGLGFSINDITDAQTSELEKLGRLDPDRNWMVLTWNSQLSFYLDALAGRPPHSLVHELALRFSGQYSFNDRLIPNFETVAGGLYSVRGYPESAVAGDVGIFGGIEYRMHIPRAFAVNKNPPTVFGRPFRVQPDEPGGRPDWDLVFKAFCDAGRVTNARALGFESNETLASVGLGGELVIANNLSFRTDWGIVLDEVGADTPTPVTVGSQRWNFVLTVLY